MVLIVFAALVAGAPQARAGRLDNFEAGVVQGDVGPAHGQHHGRSDSDPASDCIGDFFCSDVWRVFGQTLAEGGRRSALRAVPGGRSAEAPARTNGEPLIPFLAVETAWQTLGSDVQAADLQGEAGYGPVSLHHRFTHYREKTPKDRLNLSRISLLYRMSSEGGVEIDLGFGAMFLHGNEELSRFSFSTPVRLHPWKHLGAEFRPAWSYNLADYDLALYLTLRRASLKFGYRWLNSPSDSLNGPYVGLSLRL